MTIEKPYVVAELEKLQGLMNRNQEDFSFLIEQVHPAQQASAINLLHYLCLRTKDISLLQAQLHLMGLSSLTNSEGYIKSQLQAVLSHFDYQMDRPPCTQAEATSVIKQRNYRLFGNPNDGGIPSVMLTFKSFFAHDIIMVKKLLKAGMNVARINCAHDDEKTWLQMIKTIREVSKFTGIDCKIYMDLAGPKIRTVIRGKKGRLEVEEEDIILLTDKEKFTDKLPVVQCSIPGIVSQVKKGERIFFDDGLIETRVIALRPDAAELEVVQVASKNSYLKTEKGINFPDSVLHLSSLSDFDKKCIRFIQEHADMIGYSFVHNIPDLIELQDLLKNKSLPIILKIETPDSFKNLPGLLFEAMKQEYYGVMIARGDLAVELGFENMSHAQDEILSICRAAHAPVIYATEILERMNKKGLPTRAEITDASYGFLADCIMLNKGVYTAKVVKSLKKILLSKGGHYLNRNPVFRPFESATGFFKNYQGYLDKI